jgi:hypothetical protein
MRHAQIRTVATSTDAHYFLRIEAEIKRCNRRQLRSLSTAANQALAAVKSDAIHGAAVVV